MKMCLFEIDLNPFNSSKVDCRKGHEVTNNRFSHKEILMKLKIEDILKPGAKLQPREIDFNDPEIKAYLKNVQKEQKLCFERKKVDWNKLSNTYINI